MTMQPFTDSAGLLGDPAALQARLAQDGYLYLPGVVDRDTLLALRRDVVAVLDDAGWLRRDCDPFDALPAVVPWVEGEEGYLRVYDEVQRLESFHRLPHSASVLKVMRALLGGSAFPHPLSIARLVFPENDEWSTPPHQDYPNNQGTPELLATWMPLGDCPLRSGGLSILAGSHRFGLLPLEFAMGAGHRQAVLNEAMQALPWVGGDFQLGDLLVFHSHTVHRALHNRGDAMRLSVDYRFQREGEPLTEACLRPHFNRLDWEEIYRGWRSRDFAWYWREKRFETVPWDATLHALSPDAEAEAIRVSLRNERLRERRRAALKESSRNDSDA